MAGREVLQLVFGLGKHGGHQLAKTFVEALGVAATGLGEDESAAVDVVAKLFGVRQQVRRLAAADVQHGRLQQVFDGGGRRVHHLPREAELPGFFGVGGEIGGIAAVLVPFVAVAVLELGDDDRPAAFGEEQQRHRGADVRVALGVPTAFPVVRERILFVDQAIRRLRDTNRARR